MADLVDETQSEPGGGTNLVSVGMRGPIFNPRMKYDGTRNF